MNGNEHKKAYHCSLYQALLSRPSLSVLRSRGVRRTGFLRYAGVRFWNDISSSLGNGSMPCSMAYVIGITSNDFLVIGIRQRAHWN